MIITFLEKFNIEVDDDVIKEMEKIMPSFVEFASYCVNNHIVNELNSKNLSPKEFRNLLLKSLEIPFNIKRWGSFEKYLYSEFMNTINSVENTPYHVHWTYDNANPHCYNCGKYINNWILDEKDMQDWCLEWQARMDENLNGCSAYMSVDIEIMKK